MSRQNIHQQKSFPKFSFFIFKKYKLNNEIMTPEYRPMTLEAT